jgi:hypothetical protein
MVMDSEQQNINVYISNIIVNIAPAAVRILLGVTNSLAKHQVDIYYLSLLKIFYVLFSQPINKKNSIFKQCLIINH